MAYFIFLKYMDSLEDFRKKPHVKIPPKSPYANFQSLRIFKKIQFLIRKDFFQLSAHPAKPAVFFLLPHRSKARKSAPPTGLALPPWSAPTTSTGGKITTASLLLHFLIKWCPSPSSIPGNRCLQYGGIEVLQRRPLKAPGLPHLASAL
jgi:hypothetical protein